MTPKQFWRLHPDEFWWMLDANTPEKMYGKLTEGEVKEIIRDLRNG